MNKFIMGAAALFVVALGAFLFIQQSVGEPALSGAVGSESAVRAGVFEGSMAELLAREGSWKCTFSTDTAVGKSSGTVYVSGERLRGDFVSDAPAVGSVESHMITEAGWTYTWSSAMPQGFKVPRTESESTASPTQTAGSMDEMHMKMAYQCEPMVSDAALFTLPEGVTFVQL